MSVIVEEVSEWCVRYSLGMPEQIAYVLATMKHETAGTMRPIREIGSDKYFEKKYGMRKDLGNVQKGDGARFCGRGYVQVTGRRNYELFERLLGLPLAHNPDLALEHDTAMRIMMLGFRDGLFTGKKLSDYIRPGKSEFISARRCINGMDRAALIAGLAGGYLKELRGS